MKQRNLLSSLPASFKFQLWLEWLRDLGGTYSPLHDGDYDRKPANGRRDADKKPRLYQVGYHKTYWADQNKELIAA